MARLWKRRVVQAFLAGTLVVSSGTYVLADEVSNTTGLKVINSEVKFTDIKGHWAQDVIEKMAEQKIINGYPDFTFQPNQPVTKVQAVTVVMNLLKQKEAKLKTSGDKYIGVVPDWAKESIELAVYNDIVSWIDIADYDESASRMFVVELLVNALGENPNTVEGLSFLDIAELSTEEKAVLSYALKNELVEGYSDNRFRPNKLVNRAEMATFADRLFGKVGVGTKPQEEESKDDFDNGFDRIEIAIGTISRIAADVKELTIGSTTFEVADEFTVKINDKEAKFEDLKTRMEVRVVLRDEKITEIEAYAEEDKTIAAKQIVAGTISDVDFSDKEIMLDLKTFAVKNNAYVEINGELADFSYLESDMEAVVVTVDGKVESIYAFELWEASDVEFEIDKEKDTNDDEFEEARMIGDRVSDETPNLKGERLRISLNGASYRTIDLDAIDGSQRNGKEVAEDLEEAIEDALKDDRVKVTFSSADRFIFETKDSPTNKIPTIQFDGYDDVLEALGLDDDIVKGSLDEYNTWKISVKSDATQNQTYSIEFIVDDEDIDELILFTVKKGDSAEKIADAIADALIFKSDIRSVFKITVDDEEVFITPKDEENLDVEIEIRKR